MALLRKAKIKDIKSIHSLIKQFAKRRLLLDRSFNQLYETIRDYWVYLEKNKVVACCALHLSWNDLAEIKSLAVKPAYQKMGLGKMLINNCLKEAKDLGAKKVFALTYKPAYFKKFGFRRISNNRLPHKIWAECINCYKFPDCKEVAMVKNI